MTPLATNGICDAPSISRQKLARGRKPRTRVFTIDHDCPAMPRQRSIRDLFFVIFVAALLAFILAHFVQSPGCQERRIDVIRACTAAILARSARRSAIRSSDQPTARAATTVSQSTSRMENFMARSLKGEPMRTLAYVASYCQVCSCGGIRVVDVRYAPFHKESEHASHCRNGSFATAGYRLSCDL
jgi:hypothetical protein